VVGRNITVSGLARVVQDGPSVMAVRTGDDPGGKKGALLSISISGVEVELGAGRPALGAQLHNGASSGPGSPEPLMSNRFNPAAAQTRTVTGRDITPPVLQVESPQRAASVLGDAAGAATMPLRTSATDSQSEMVGGSAGVAWALSQGAARPPARMDASGKWTADVPLPGFGAYRISVWATDQAGTTLAPVDVPVTVISSVPATLEEGLNEEEYLAALLSFAQEQVKLPGAPPPPLDTRTLVGALGQPVDRLSQPLSAADDAGGREVNELNRNRERGADCVFSFARDFPDQWYDLDNPPDPATRSVTITLRDVDFPLSIEKIATAGVAVRLSSSATVPGTVVSLHRGSAGGDAATSDGIASTRRGNAASWSALYGTAPAGDWQLTFGADAAALFRSGAIDDVLLVISWTGQAPAWTS
jgi:hypothetical protein